MNGALASCHGLHRVLSGAALCATLVLAGLVPSADAQQPASGSSRGGSTAPSGAAPATAGASPVPVIGAPTPVPGEGSFASPPAVVVAPVPEVCLPSCATGFVCVARECVPACTQACAPDQRCGADGRCAARTTAYEAGGAPRCRGSRSRPSPSGRVSSGGLSAAAALTPSSAVLSASSSLASGASPAPDDAAPQEATTQLAVGLGYTGITVSNERDGGGEEVSVGLFTLLFEAGRTILPGRSHPGLFLRGLAQVSLGDVFVLRLGGRIGYEFEVLRRPAFRWLLTPSTALSFGITEIGFVGAFEIAGEAKFVLGDGRFSVWVRPTVFDWQFLALPWSSWNLFCGGEMRF